MPLSKARDRERKRLLRLESVKVQPKVAYPPPQVVSQEPMVWCDEVVWYDADGNPVYD